MKALVAALALASAAGCAMPTWKEHLRGAALPADKVVLVGSFVAVPPITQRGVSTPTGGSWDGNAYSGSGRAVFVGKFGGHVAALFTHDLSEAWNRESVIAPLRLYEWAWFPMGGHFFVEVPRSPRLYLRGIAYVTDGGRTNVELPAQVDVPRDARVLYVGEIRLVRSGDRRTIFNEKLAEARKEAEAGGHDTLLAAPWTTSLFRPIDPGARAEASRR